MDLILSLVIVRPDGGMDQLSFVVCQPRPLSRISRVCVADRTDSAVLAMSANESPLAAANRRMAKSDEKAM
jgi:hypothetical protein